MSELQVIGIGGPPGVGKSTLMYSLLNRFRPQSQREQEVRLGLCRGRYFYPPQSVYVLGIYDGSMFSGTDKLSMACQPDCVKFIQWVAEQSAKEQLRTSVLFEGDRLFTESFIRACLAAAPGSKFLTLTDTDEALEERRAGRNLERGDGYAQWVRGRVSKVRNIEEAFGLEPLQWKDEQETAAISSVVYGHVAAWLDGADADTVRLSFNVEEGADVPADTRNLSGAQP